MIANDDDSEGNDEERMVLDLQPIQENDEEYQLSSRTTTTEEDDTIRDTISIALTGKIAATKPTKRILKSTETTTLDNNFGVFRPHATSSLPPSIHNNTNDLIKQQQQQQKAINPEERIDNNDDHDDGNDDGHDINQRLPSFQSIMEGKKYSSPPRHEQHQDECDEIDWRAIMMSDSHNEYDNNSISTHGMGQAQGHDEFVANVQNQPFQSDQPQPRTKSASYPVNETQIGEQFSSFPMSATQKALKQQQFQKQHQNEGYCRRPRYHQGTSVGEANDYRALLGSSTSHDSDRQYDTVNNIGPSSFVFDGDHPQANQLDNLTERSFYGLNDGIDDTSMFDLRRGRAVGIMGGSQGLPNINTRSNSDTVIMSQYRANRRDTRMMMSSQRRNSSGANRQLQSLPPNRRHSIELPYTLPTSLSMGGDIFHSHNKINSMIDTHGMMMASNADVYDDGNNSDDEMIIDDSGGTFMMDPTGRFAMVPGTNASVDRSSLLDMDDVLEAPPAAKSASSSLLSTTPATVTMKTISSISKNQEYLSRQQLITQKKLEDIQNKRRLLREQQALTDAKIQAKEMQRRNSGSNSATSSSRTTTSNTTGRFGNMSFAELSMSIPLPAQSLSSTVARAAPPAQAISNPIRKPHYLPQKRLRRQLDDNDNIQLDQLERLRQQQDYILYQQQQQIMDAIMTRRQQIVVGNPAGTNKRSSQRSNNYAFLPSWADDMSLMNNNIDTNEEVEDKDDAIITESQQQQDISPLSETTKKQKQEHLQYQKQSSSSLSTSSSSSIKKFEQRQPSNKHIIFQQNQPKIIRRRRRRHNKNNETFPVQLINAILNVTSSSSTTSSLLRTIHDADTNDNAAASSIPSVAWLPDGKSIMILDPDRFCIDVLQPIYDANANPTSTSITDTTSTTTDQNNTDDSKQSYVDVASAPSTSNTNSSHCKYDSFIRKLHRWGFQRLIPGSGIDTFYHPLFQTSAPHLANDIEPKIMASSSSLSLAPVLTASTSSHNRDTITSGTAAAASTTADGNNDDKISLLLPPSVAGIEDLLELREFVRQMKNKDPKENA